MKRYRSVPVACCLATLMSSCGDSAGSVQPASAVEAAVRSYTAAYLRGDGAGAYALLSSRCKQVETPEQLDMAAAAAAVLYGQAHMVSIAPVVHGDRATVTYRFSQPAIDQENQPWVYEGNSWRNDNC